MEYARETPQSPQLLLNCRFSQRHLEPSDFGVLILLAAQDKSVDELVLNSPGPNSECLCVGGLRTKPLLRRFQQGILLRSAWVRWASEGTIGRRLRLVGVNGL